MRHCIVLVFAFVFMVAIPISGCAQLASALPVVQSVAEIARQVCEADDDPLACLRKCEAHAAECECGVGDNGDCGLCQESDESDE